MSRGLDSTGHVPGVIFNHGKPWEEQRQFFRETLISLGMGKPSGTLFDIICQEQEQFCDILSKRAERQGGIVELEMLFHELTSNVAMRLISGKPHKQNDAKVTNMKFMIRDLFDLLERSTLVETIQMNSKMFVYLTKLLGIKSMVDVCKPLDDFVKEEASHGVPNSESGNFVDRYLAKRDKAGSTSSFYKTDGELHMVGMIFDLYVGGKLVYVIIII